MVAKSKSKSKRSGSMDGRHVPRFQLRARLFKTGKQVMAKWKTKWLPATIMSVVKDATSDKVKGYKVSWDKSSGTSIILRQNVRSKKEPLQKSSPSRTVAASSIAKESKKSKSAQVSGPESKGVATSDKASLNGGSSIPIDSRSSILTIPAVITNPARMTAALPKANECKKTKSAQISGFERKDDPLGLVGRDVEIYWGSTALSNLQDASSSGWYLAQVESYSFPNSYVVKYKGDMTLEEMRLFSSFECASTDDDSSQRWPWRYPVNALEQERSRSKMRPSGRAPKGMIWNGAEGAWQNNSEASGASQIGEGGTSSKVFSAKAPEKKSVTVRTAAEKGSKQWSSDEWARLLEGYAKHGTNWVEVARVVGGRSNGEVRKKWYWNYTFSGTRNRGPWSKEEIDLFRTAHAQHGNSWEKVARMVRTRTPAQCQREFNKKSSNVNAPIIFPSKKAPEKKTASIPARKHLSEKENTNQENAPANGNTTTAPQKKTAEGAWQNNSEASVVLQIGEGGTSSKASSKVISAKAPEKKSATVRTAAEKGRKRWSSDECARLLEGYAKHGTNWVEVARVVGGRSNGEVRKKWYWNYTFSGTRNRGPWSKEEIDLFRTAHAQHGNSWEKVARMVRTRSPTQCQSFNKKSSNVNAPIKFPSAKAPEKNAASIPARKHLSEKENTNKENAPANGNTTTAPQKNTIKSANTALLSAEKEPVKLRPKAPEKRNSLIEAMVQATLSDEEGSLQKCLDKCSKTLRERERQSSNGESTVADPFPFWKTYMSRLIETTMERKAPKSISGAVQIAKWTNTAADALEKIIWSRALKAHAPRLALQTVVVALECIESFAKQQNCLATSAQAATSLHLMMLFRILEVASNPFCFGVFSIDAKDPLRSDLSGVFFRLLDWLPVQTAPTLGNPLPILMQIETRILDFSEIFLPCL